MAAPSSWPDRSRTSSEFLWISIAPAGQHCADRNYSLLTTRMLDFLTLLQPGLLRIRQHELVATDNQGNGPAQIGNRVERR
jgi:hypothetical protein